MHKMLHTCFLLNLAKLELGSLRENGKDTYVTFSAAM